MLVRYMQLMTRPRADLCVLASESYWLLMVLRRRLSVQTRRARGIWGDLSGCSRRALNRRWGWWSVGIRRGCQGEPSYFRRVMKGEGHGGEFGAVCPSGDAGGLHACRSMTSWWPPGGGVDHGMNYDMAVAPLTGPGSSLATPSYLVIHLQCRSYSLDERYHGHLPTPENWREGVGSLAW